MKNENNPMAASTQICQGRSPARKASTPLTADTPDIHQGWSLNKNKMIRPTNDPASLLNIQGNQRIQPPYTVLGALSSVSYKPLRKHTSKASATYYWKNHLQYFAALHLSLGEVARVTRPGSPCFLVVQDSYYKDVHNDLPTHLTEMATSVGFSLRRRFDYPVKHTLAGLHRFRRSYRSCATATESVLWLDKAAV